MDQKRLILAFLVTLGSISSSHAHIIEEGVCKTLASKNSGIAVVDKAIKNYNVDSFRLCEYERTFEYDVYSNPYITPKGVCLIDALSFRKFKNTTTTTLSANYKFYSMSKRGFCQKDREQYVSSIRITSDEFVKVVDSLKKRQDSQEPFSLIWQKRGWDYHAADFDLFNKLFIQKKLVLTSVIRQDEGDQLVLQFRRQDKDSTDFWLRIQYNFLGGMVVRYFNSFGVSD